MSKEWEFQPGNALSLTESQWRQIISDLRWASGQDERELINSFSGFAAMSPDEKQRVVATQDATARVMVDRDMIIANIDDMLQMHNPE